MEVRILSAEDVRQALPMSIAVEAMKEAYVQLSREQVSMPLRSRIDVTQHNGLTLFMPALLHDTQDMAIKIVSVFPDNIENNIATINAIVVALDAKTGIPMAIIEGASLTAIRTGAASGAATDLLARRDSKTLAIFGSGVQARTQLEAVCTVRSIEQVWVFSLDKPGAREFVDEMTGRGPIPDRITIVESPTAAIAEADVICTATTSSTPVFNGKELKSGTHINAVGSFTPEMQELDAETVKKSRVVVDAIDAALDEAGDLIIPINQGLITPDWIHAELGDIVTGEKPGRTSSDQITLFKSVGLAVQDAISAGRALSRAIEASLGQIISL
jgi:ornithine cyclodeaminase/alanine dehydrogenase-like protein (mu-crystallin family)